MEIDIEESHYNLPMKDIALLDFVSRKCESYDYLFKGDDDILGRVEKLFGNLASASYNFMYVKI